MFNFDGKPSNDNVLVDRDCLKRMSNVFKQTTHPYPSPYADYMDQLLKAHDENRRKGYFAAVGEFGEVEYGHAYDMSVSIDSYHRAKSMVMDYIDQRRAGGNDIVEIRHVCDAPERES